MKLEFDRTLALIGMRACGKTTVGRILARRLGVPFLDLDEEVLTFARHSGVAASTVAELVEATSWAFFRELEADCLKKVVEPTPRVVLATGGGVVEREDNRAWLVRATVAVYLEASADLLRERLAADPRVRPALTAGGDPLAELGEFLARREPWYRAVAALQVSAEGTPDEVALRVEQAFLERVEATP